jgi:curli production assembly/transport component CsgE
MMQHFHFHLRSNGTLRKVTLGLCAVMLSCMNVQAHAQDKAEAPLQQVTQAPDAKPSPDDGKPEYGGVVVNQTLTGLGHYFYVNFSQSWSEKDDISDYVVAIKERPSPRGGTEVLIFSDDVAVFRSFLPRSYAQVDGLSEAAVAQVHSRLSQMRIQAALFINNDLAGSGL